MDFQVQIPTLSDANEALKYATLDNLADTLGIADMEGVEITANENSFTQDGRWLIAGRTVTVSLNRGLWQHVDESAFEDSLVLDASEVPILLSLAIDNYMDLKATDTEIDGFVVSGSGWQQEGFIGKLSCASTAPHITFQNKGYDYLTTSLSFYNTEDALADAHGMDIPTDDNYYEEDVERDQDAFVFADDEDDFTYESELEIVDLGDGELDLLDYTDEDEDFFKNNPYAPVEYENLAHGYEDFDDVSLIEDDPEEDFSDTVIDTDNLELVAELDGLDDIDIEALSADLAELHEQVVAEQKAEEKAARREARLAKRRSRQSGTTVASTTTAATRGTGFGYTAQNSSATQH